MIDKKDVLELIDGEIAAYLAVNDTQAIRILRNLRHEIVDQLDEKGE